MKGNVTPTLDERAAFFPSRGERNEVLGRRELHVDVECILRCRNGTHDGVILGTEEEVDVDRGSTPTHHDRRCAPDEIYPHRCRCRPRQVLHQADDPGTVYGRTHSAARSKLTRRRTRALYRECAESASSARRRRPLLKLACCGIAAETDFQIFDLPESEPFGPQEFAMLLARIDKADRGCPARSFVFSGET